MVTKLSLHLPKGVEARGQKCDIDTPRSLAEIAEVLATER